MVFILLSCLWLEILKESNKHNNLSTHPWQYNVAVNGMGPGTCLSGFCHSLAVCAREGHFGFHIYKMDVIVISILRFWGIKWIHICKACDDEASIILNTFYIINTNNDLDMGHTVLPSRSLQSSGEFRQGDTRMGSGQAQWRHKGGEAKGFKLCPIWEARGDGSCSPGFRKWVLHSIKTFGIQLIHNHKNIYLFFTLFSDYAYINLFYSLLTLWTQ